MKSRDAKQRFERTKALFDEERYDEALAQFQAASAADPKAVGPHAELCFFYHECLHDPTLAADHARRFLSLGGKDPEIESLLKSIDNGFTKPPEPSED